ncbi:endonuclease/exonuclease/phosphatase family metal-dependent hydrolase [Sphingomonas zeicaulis]|uniref:endonuclease/exonuclease/phosphatase family protein n=1 Tax=Sphingomonas zeicaulis TaxID=1632740 RepID=UPI003D1F8574
MRRTLPFRWLLIAALLPLAACGRLPHPRTLACAAAPRAPLTALPGGRMSTTVDVLTYNIEGLPWPARSGRSDKLKRIGTILDDLRRAGEAPDIILFQEAFSHAAARAVERSNYPAIAPGPSRVQRAPVRADTDLPGKPRLFRGEIGLRLMHSGLAVASRYPIVKRIAVPYSRPTCAGIDCLANKGIMLARVVIPGVPVPLQIVNTHMNSQGASGVSPARHLAAHNAETAELGIFMRRHWDQSLPVIFGGDFNMRDAPKRFAPFWDSQRLALVHRFCTDPANRCDVRMSWDGDEPWMDTQDLQLFASGAQVTVRPIRVEAMFDGSESSPMLSDHDGFRVLYRLEWRAETRMMSGCEPAHPGADGTR